MNTKKKRLMLAAALGAAVAMPAAVLRADNEFGSNTPYYEDDAWYDVSEWFDGNDYNPTDEAIGRWDDEQFSFADNATSTDQDNDWNSYEDYGYTDRASNNTASTTTANDTDQSDWFYDYYDDGYADWDVNFYSYYYDTDDDGLYDAYASYADTDDDGFYEDFSYIVFDFESDQQAQDKGKQQAQNEQKQLKSTLMQLTGNVEQTKTVQVRDREHLVAMVKGQGGGTMPVDLGPAEGVKVSQGDQLTAKGHPVKVGDKRLFIATDASLENGSISIDRSGKKYQGTIEKTKSINVKGTEHRLAKVKTKEGKTMMVDLGPAENLSAKLKQGSKLTVQGVPVKVKNRVVLMARQITQDGEKTEIERQSKQSAS